MSLPRMTKDARETAVAKAEARLEITQTLMRWGLSASEEVTLLTEMAYHRAARNERPPKARSNAEIGQAGKDGEG